MRTSEGARSQPTTTRQMGSWGAQSKNLPVMRGTCCEPRACIKRSNSPVRTCRSVSSAPAHSEECKPPQEEDRLEYAGALVGAPIHHRFTLMVGGLNPPSLEEEEEAKKASGQGVIFVLEEAQLEVAQVGKGYVLLNCDDHHNFLKKHSKDPAMFRPDICHQALLAILDSPLNKAGKLKAVYVHTQKNVLISINPKVRLPRTFKRFCGLMAQLLQKLSIRATNGPDKLMKVIKGPVTKHLPLDCKRLGFSWAATKRVPMHEFVAGLEDDKTVVFVVGAFARGKIDTPWVDEKISISEYPLSAAYAIGRITNAFEQKWSIV